MNNSNKTLSLAIMSGKGGVGKTNIALNLGYSLFKQGCRVLLMDCDLGLANLDVLLGIVPDHTLPELLVEGVNASDVVAKIDPQGFDVLPAASGVPELVDMDEDMRRNLANKLMELAGGYHFVILDLGAGINSTVRSLAAMAQQHLVIVTPEPTSLTDSYALIKVLATQHQIRHFCVVVNLTSDATEAALTFKRLSQACEKFLGVTLTNVGYIRQDNAVTEAVHRQTPLLQFSPNTPAAKDILSLAEKYARFREREIQSLETRPILDPFPHL